jgi:hypothetical protein
VTFTANVKDNATDLSVLLFNQWTEATQKWKDLEEFPGYQVSDFGLVRNPDGELLQLHRAARNAGLYVRLGKTTRLVHKLVLLAFVGPGIKPRHKDGNKLDNRLSNLCYGEPRHSQAGKRCRNNHELVGGNVEFWGKNRICVACREGKPPNRELPEIL